LTSKLQKDDILLREDNPDQVINHLVTSSSLSSVSQMITSEKMYYIYKSDSGYYEVDIIIDEQVENENQLNICTNNADALIENINIILSNCIKNMKQGKAISFRLFSTEAKRNISDREQYSELQLTVAISLIEYLNNFGFEKCTLLGECKGKNKLQSISPWIYEHCNLDIMNFIFANITLLK
jgi:hypothetical protein